MIMTVWHQDQGHPGLNLLRPDQIKRQRHGRLGPEMPVFPHNIPQVIFLMTHRCWYMICQICFQIIQTQHSTQTRSESGLPLL